MAKAVSSALYFRDVWMFAFQNTGWEKVGGDVVPRGMNKKLQILHLEDDPDFAELVRSLFAQDGLDVEVKCVGDRAAFQAALDTDAFDVIISDYHLPSFSGLDALAMVRKKDPHVPFILVSGTVGEQAAIESLKAGSTDYLLKQNPDRLPSAAPCRRQKSGPSSGRRKPNWFAAKNISARSWKIRSICSAF